MVWLLCSYLISEKVRQIQDKLEEFIQALNKEKWSGHSGRAAGVFSFYWTAFIMWSLQPRTDFRLEQSFVEIIPNALAMTKMILSVRSVLCVSRTVRNDGDFFSTSVCVHADVDLEQKGK